MVTTNEMKNAVHKNCKLIYKSGQIKECYVEYFTFEEDEDEEPMILYTLNMVAYQSELDEIVVLDQAYSHNSYLVVKFKLYNTFLSQKNCGNGNKLRKEEKHVLYQIGQATPLLRRGACERNNSFK